MNQCYELSIDEPEVWCSRWTRGMKTLDEPEVWSLDEPVYTLLGAEATDVCLAYVPLLALKWKPYDVCWPSLQPYWTL